MRIPSRLLFFAGEIVHTIHQLHLHLIHDSIINCFRLTNEHSCHYIRINFAKYGSFLHYRQTKNLNYRKGSIDGEAKLCNKELLEWGTDNRPNWPDAFQLDIWDNLPTRKTEINAKYSVHKLFKSVQGCHGLANVWPYWWANNLLEVSELLHHFD